MKIYDGSVIRDMTAEEEAAMIEAAARQEVEERHRPLTISEVSEMLIRTQINTLDVDDQTAYRMRQFYPEYAVGCAYAVGDKFVYNDELYKVLTAHTSQADWVPGTGTESLYVRIDEEHDGSKYDPIPYSGNMALEKDKYYVQEGIVYLCTRDTGNPVYNALDELVGIYVTQI